MSQAIENQQFKTDGTFKVYVTLKEAKDIYYAPKEELIIQGTFMPNQLNCIEIHIPFSAVLAVYSSVVRFKIVKHLGGNGGSRRS